MQSKLLFLHFVNNCWEQILSSEKEGTFAKVSAAALHLKLKRRYESIIWFLKAAFEMDNFCSWCCAEWCYSATDPRRPIFCNSVSEQAIYVIQCPFQEPSQNLSVPPPLFKSSYVLRHNSKKGVWLRVVARS